MPLPTRSESPPRRFTLRLPVELMLLVCGAFWLITANRAFFSLALKGRDTTDPSAWALGIGLALIFLALHFLLLAPLANRFTVKPLLALLIVATAFAMHFMQQFGVYLDPSMLRNTLHTDVQEARELFSWAIVPRLLLYAALPLLLLWRVQPIRWRWPRALAVRAASMGSSIFALQWSQASLQSPPVIEMAGQALLPQPLVSMEISDVS